MLFCCCFSSEKKKIEQQRPDTPLKTIQKIIMTIENYNIHLFKVIIYSFVTDEFLCLTGTGFVFINMLRDLFNQKEFKLVQVFRILCITTKKLLYTNKQGIYGPIYLVDVDFFMTS